MKFKMEKKKSIPMFTQKLYLKYPDFSPPDSSGFLDPE